MKYTSSPATSSEVLINVQAADPSKYQEKVQLLAIGILALAKNLKSTFSLTVDDRTSLRFTRQNRAIALTNALSQIQVETTDTRTSLLQKIIPTVASPAAETYDKTVHLKLILDDVVDDLMTSYS